MTKETEEKLERHRMAATGENGVTAEERYYGWAKDMISAGECTWGEVDAVWNPKPETTPRRGMLGILLAAEKKEARLCDELFLRQCEAEYKALLSPVLDAEAAAKQEVLDAVEGFLTAQASFPWNCGAMLQAADALRQAHQKLKNAKGTA